MKTIWAHVAALVFLSLAPFGVPAADGGNAGAASDLFGFRGDYSGRVTFSSGGIGRPRVSILSRRNREIGKISARTQVFSGGLSMTFQETLRIRGRRVSYFVKFSGPAVVSGRGTGNVTFLGNSIRYRVPATVSGGAFVINGAMRKSGSRTIITERWVGPTALVIQFLLTKQGA